MARINPAYLWRRLFALPNDSRIKTFAVALLIALSAALVVSTSSVFLRPLQEANREKERQARIVALVKEAIGDVGPLRARVVDLSTGEFAPEIDPVTYDQRAAAGDPDRSVEIPADADIAGLGRRAKHARVFIREEEGRIQLVVLPVHGQGYQSMLYGYLALRGDLATVAALSFYEQGDTPGLGERITEQTWQSRWRGKKVADDDGNIEIRVVQGKAGTPYEVDGISGATRTGRGVTNLLHYWLGDHGFGPFLNRLSSERT